MQHKITFAYENKNICGYRCTTRDSQSNRNVNSVMLKNELPSETVVTGFMEPTFGSINISYFSLLGETI